MASSSRLGIEGLWLLVYTNSIIYTLSSSQYDWNTVKRDIKPSHHSYFLQTHTPVLVIHVICCHLHNSILSYSLSSFHAYTEQEKMSRIMRKQTFCICENKDADQLRGNREDQLRSNREADQRLCFCYIDSTIPLLSKSEISSH